MTEIGEVVNSIMKESFPTIVDEHFTANMESLLDAVAEGKVNWKTVVENFYPDLKEAIDKAENELEKVTICLLYTSYRTENIILLRNALALTVKKN